MERIGMFRFLWHCIRALCVLAVLLAAGAGFYIGNAAYERLINSPWNLILGIRDESGNLQQVHAGEKRYGWEPVEVSSKDGTVLAGTYVKNPNPSHKTVILLHGLYSNRTMCLPLIPMYRRLGYNVLLIDQRGHGESGGAHTMWGMKEMDDMDAWMDWLQAKDPSVLTGLHGISLGAAMALLYSGTDRGQSLSFVVADSSYADLMSLAKEKVYDWSGDDRILFSMDLVNPFFQAAMYAHTGKLLQDIEPADAVAKSAAPTLFLHGGADRLVPPEAAQILGNASGASRKEIRIFEGAGHAAEFSVNPRAYTEIVQNFILGRQ